MRMAGYTRKSDREKGDEEPLETQRQSIESWCRQEGHELVGFYEDPNVRNKVPVHLRPGGGLLLRDAARGKFEAVVVYRMDRWTRRGGIAHQAFDQLAKHDIGFCSATEPINHLTPESKMMRSVLLALAEWERDTIERRCTDGMQRRARAGLYCGGIVPYGYRVEAGRLAPDEEEAPVVRDLFHWFVVERRGSHQIAAQLNEMGVPTAARRGRPNHPDGTAGVWRPQQVRALLTNPLYGGAPVWGKTTRRTDEKRIKAPAERQIAQTAPGLVPRELWEAAQWQRETNRALSPRNSRYEWLLRGRIKCALCGHTYVGALGAAPKGTTERVRYYGCLGRTHSGKAFGDGRRCPAPYVQAEKLEADLWSLLTDRLAHPEEIEAALGSRWAVEERDRECRVEVVDALQRTLAQKDQIRRNTVDLLTEGILTKEDAHAKLERLAGEKAAIEDRLANLANALQLQQERLARVGQVRDRLESVRAALSGPLTFAERQQLVYLLVERIEIRAEAGAIVAKYTLCFAPTEERVAGRNVPSWTLAFERIPA